jgi:hypothetical protein
LYRSQSVLTNNTLEEDTTWRLNERWQPTPFGSQPLALDDAPTGNWRPNPLFLPDRDVGNWGRTRLPTTKTRSAALDRNLDVLWDEIVAEMKEKGRNRPCESFWIACGVKEGQDFMRSRVD